MFNNQNIMQVAAFISKLISFYSFLIWIRILLSWVNPYTREGSITYYFSIIVDPYLKLFRSRHFHFGMLDFSPIFAIASLSFLQAIANIFANYGYITLGLIISLSLNIIWGYAISFFFLFLFLSLILRTITSFTGSRGVMYQIGQMSSSLISKIRNTFFKNRFIKESTLNLIALSITLVSYFIIRYLFALLILFTRRIPF